MVGNGQRAELGDTDVLRLACWRADRLRLRGLRLRRMRQRYLPRQAVQDGPENHCCEQATAVRT
jgi:hypothetical protein